MEQDDLAAVHTTLIGFTKRAEKATEQSLVATFVDSAPLFALLSTDNNQVIYGRRGTGKTHALKVLSEHVQQQKNGISVFLDMRTIGSNGSSYSDSSRSLSERASALLSDVVSALCAEFYSIALVVIEDHPHPEEVARRLDTLHASICTLKISGDVGEEIINASIEKLQEKSNIATTAGGNLSIRAELSQNSS